MPSGVYKKTIEHKKKISEATKGRIGYWTGKKRPPFSEEWKRRISKANKGKSRKLSPKALESIIIGNKKRSGSKHPSWNGGVNSKNQKTARVALQNIARKIIVDFGYPLKKNECVHHTDSNPRNNNIKNLVVFSKQEHRNWHNFDKFDERISILFEAIWNF